MSDVPFFPKEEEISSNSDQAGEGKPQFKRPEFILIDDRPMKSQQAHFGADSTGKPEEPFTRKKADSSKGPVSLRFICLLGFIFCLVFGLGMLLWSIAMTTLAVFSLFRNKKFNQSMRSFWKIFTNTAIAGFGFTLGMISPTLGLGLLALYFSIAGDLVGDDLLRRVIKSSFNRL